MPDVPQYGFRDVVEELRKANETLQAILQAIVELARELRERTAPGGPIRGG